MRSGVGGCSSGGGFVCKQECADTFFSEEVADMRSLVHMVGSLSLLKVHLRVPAGTKNSRALGFLQ